MTDVDWAKDLARRLLADPLPRRWAHTQGVAAKAASVAHLVGEDADLLVSAAWLHDIGYSPELVVTGFHPLDGARYLRDTHHADDRLCRLVAHHTCARIEARNRGLGNELAEFPEVGGLLADALTYADITTSPDGAPVAVETRLAEIADRYGPGHLVTLTMSEAGERVKHSANRVASLI